MLDQMMKSITRELFLDRSVANFTDDREDKEMDVIRRIITEVVASRLDELDQMFLYALNAYLHGAIENKEEEAAGMLLAIKDEVIRQLHKKLTPEMQVLSVAAEITDVQERSEFITRSLDTDAYNLFSCSAESLERAAEGVIIDMESLESIPDHALLARICLVREEARKIAARQPAVLGSKDPNYGKVKIMAVPQKTLVFLNNLIGISSSDQRCFILEKAFKEDGPVTASDDSSEVGAHRPGRLLRCLDALKQETSNVRDSDLDETLAKLEGKTLPSAVPIDDSVLQRLEEIRNDIFSVLADLGSKERLRM